MLIQDDGIPPDSLKSNFPPRFVNLFVPLRLPRATPHPVFFWRSACRLHPLMMSRCVSRCYLKERCPPNPQILREISCLILFNMTWGVANGLRTKWVNHYNLFVFMKGREPVSILRNIHCEPVFRQGPTLFQPEKKPSNCWV